MTDPLRRALDDLAGEVRMVDLRDRALRTSRRRTRQRLALVGISAAGAVLAVSAAALLWLRADSEPLPPAGPTTSSPTVSSSPTSTAPLSYLPGTAIYLESDGANLRVVRIVAGQSHTTTIASANFHEGSTATLSPDGSTVAFEPGCDPGQGGTSADLSVVSVAGGTPRAVTSGIRCDGGSQPIWFPDSASLRVVHYNDGVGGTDACGRMAVVTGALTPLGTRADANGWCDYVAFAPGGAFRARQVGSQWVVETAAGGAVRSVALFNSGPIGSAIQGLSADGRYLAIGIHNTDPGIQRDAYAVVDTVSGSQVPLATLLGRSPADGTNVAGISFLADGGAVVATYVGAGTDTLTFTWYLLSAIGEVTAIVDHAPGWINNGQFLYLP